MEDYFKEAPNNPPHLFRADALYMLTATTYQKEKLVESSERKIQLKNAFFKAAELYRWTVVAWVVLDNHYHAIVQSPGNPGSLSKFIGSCHKYTARQWNRLDQTPDRKVWYNYWDTCIRSERDYLSRLKYIFWNPVKHGFAKDPAEYPFSNYVEFVDIFSGINVDEVENVPEA